MPSTRKLMHDVVSDTGFQGAVEASMMLVAHEVLNEDPATWGHENRAATALAVFRGVAQDIARFRRMFAWRAVYEPAIQGQVYNPGTGAITPEAIVDADLDGVVRGFWNTASNVGPEPVT